LKKKKRKRDDMQKRFVSIWFWHLTTDWFAIRHPELCNIPFVLSSLLRGRMIVVAANAIARLKGIHSGMVVADARAEIPLLKVLDDKPGLTEKLLNRLAEWCIRFTHYDYVDLPDGLILDVTGCAHLWGSDEQYLTEIVNRLTARGYVVRVAMADTPGAAWAIARYGSVPIVVKKGEHVAAIASLPPEALRLEIETIERLHKLGLRQVKDLLSLPRYSLCRRFGAQLMQRLNQALGLEEEIIQPLYPVISYSERLPSFEPIVTRTGIEIALQRLLETLCNRLQREEKGLRTACFACYRVDGKTERIDIGTNSPSHNAVHLFKLFEIKIDTIRPEEGIELFVLDALKVEEISSEQKGIWKETSGLLDTQLSQLLDRLSVKFGSDRIHRYLPDEHYLPEKAFKRTSSLEEKPTAEWKVERPRPMHLLSSPEPIEVTAPVPDYPPMNFRYKGKLHKIIKADGPERMEQEWWIANGRHRDYYYVEDEEGKRYWLFRSGHYENEKHRWFIHGFFA
jgi:protein ImuB